MLSIKRYLFSQAIVVASLLVALAVLLLLEATDILTVGRDVRPPALITLGMMAVAGFLLSYRLRFGWAAQLWTLLPWLLLLYLLVAFAMGVMVPDKLFLGWYAAAVVVVAVPWLLGAAAGRFLLRSRGHP